MINYPVEVSAPRPVQTRVIFLNGPPGSGKDTIANQLYLEGGRHLKFAAPLKAAARAMFKLPDDLWYVLEQNGSQEAKTEIRNIFFKQSWRSLLIWLSEDVMKPKFGKDVFGQLAIRSLNVTGSPFTVFSDCGFAEEVEVVAKFVGYSNCQIWNIVRPGYDFRDDSRSYISSSRVPTIVFNNEHDMDMLRIQIRLKLRQFMESTQK